MKKMTVEEYLKSIRTPEEKAYERYAEVIGGEPEPIGLEVPSGYPAGVEERGGVAAVYEECIKKGVTWEELLDYKPLPNDVII
ncbi:hypothetical protein [uncultured Phascolarctobacterium sp.]|uniref:hypothetical protein n=1 Tax=uncultured Phascolarctobacterium sp. TaxID=512296 RepID=UPI0025D34CB2|nr:hypothetical protein [uncultured Phascolarctobacterium sp.]